MKKPLAVITSDWHIHKWKQFNQNNRRLKENLDLFQFLGKETSILNVPILFCGDLFEDAKHLSNIVITQSIKAYKKHIQNRDISFVAISGNHDQEERNTNQHTSSTYLEAFSHSFNSFKLIDNSFREFNNFVVFGVPYLTGNIGLKETLRDFRKIKTPKGKYRILLIHTDLHGALDTDGREVGTTQNIPKDLTKFFRGFDIVLCGHIHKPMVIQTSNPKIVMVGAPQQQNRGDKNCEMGYWILWEKYEALSIEFIPLLHYSKFIEIPEDEYKNLSDSKKKENFYIPISSTKAVETANGLFTSFSSNTQRKRIAKAWANQVGEKNKRRVKALIKIL